MRGRNTPKPDEETLAHWKQLAESRKKALEDTLEENEFLHGRIEELENEIQLLQSIANDAKRLAELITSPSDSENEAPLKKDHNTKRKKAKILKY